MPFEDDRFDLVVASHVIEHLRNATELVAECVRVCRPGGHIYIETPSERSLWLPGMPFGHDQFQSTSFFDDPTHTGRPWTPQALYRLASYLGCEALEVRHVTSWKMRFGLPLMLLASWLRRRPDIFAWAVWEAVGWASCAVIRKPETMQGAPEITYFYAA
jgi:SAM-dependent methyltransferase